MKSYQPNAKRAVRERIHAKNISLGLYMVYMVLHELKY